MTGCIFTMAESGSVALSQAVSRIVGEMEQMGLTKICILGNHCNQLSSDVVCAAAETLTEAAR